MLQNKLDGLRKHFSDKDVRKDVLDNLIRQLTKESSWNWRTRRPTPTR